jgi:hypothetical protein
MNLENFENFGCGMVLFAALIGCDVYIHYVFEAISRKVILFLIEAMVVVFASRSLKFHSAPDEYMEYAFSDALLSDI